MSENTVSQGGQTNTDSGTSQTNDNQITFVFEEDGFEMYDYSLLEDQLVLSQSVQEYISQ